MIQIDYKLKNQLGFTLLEVLISMLVLSIGLFGIASLQTNAVKLNTDALFLTRANNLSYFITDAMRANRQAALNGEYDTAFSTNNCLYDTEINVNTIAVYDVKMWLNLLACNLPNGEGSISRVDQLFTVTIQWDNRDQPSAKKQIIINTIL